MTPISPSEAARIQTHARSILEGEGQEEHDPALVEAVARALAPHLAGYRLFDAMPRDRVQLRAQVRDGVITDINDATQDDAKDAAQAALSTIRKHQAGE